MMENLPQMYQYATESFPRKRESSLYMLHLSHVIALQNRRAYIHVGSAKTSCL
jgi:hypothetical protein